MHLNEKNRTLKLAEEDEGPSKSELKRQMTERQKLAEVLAALSSDALKAILLDEAIKTAIAETNKIKSFWFLAFIAGYGLSPQSNNTTATIQAKILRSQSCWNDDTKMVMPIIRRMILAKRLTPSLLNPL